tara:strand:- start:743 stop:2014 length:1272 start_codon:yes stop_codon:yes gene_type:complete
MSGFNLDVNFYSLDDLKKLFTISSDIPITNEELDVKIANILMNAKNKYTEFEVQQISSFLGEAKLKYKNFIDFYNIEYDNIHPLTDALKEKMVDSKFLDKNEHAVIEKPLDIPMQTKLVNVYSNQRDRKKFPHANNFEIDLPQTLHDIKSVALFDYNMSFRVVNVSRWYQNTRMSFLLPNISGDLKFEIIVAEGQYANEIFADTLSYLLNNKVQEVLGNNYNGVDYSRYANFKTHVSPLSGIFEVYNVNSSTGEQDKFVFPFDEPEAYTINKDQPKMVYENKDYWGLGYQMGFNKKRYESKQSVISIVEIKDGFSVSIVRAHVLTAPRVLDMRQDGMAYLEIDHLNKNDQPDSNGGGSNSFFARIAMLYTGFEQDYGGVYGEGVEVDLESMSKLKIRLRHYNQVLVDCQNQDFDFTLAVTCKK